MPNIKNHPIADNQLRVNNKEYFGLGLTKVLVGIETQEIDPATGELRHEIITNESSGLNESRVAIESKEIYCLKTQKHHPWFILDLETGRGRTDSWFPGSKIKGDVLQLAEIKESASDEAASIEIVENATVEILDITRINQTPTYDGWYKVRFNREGYLKTTALKNLRYE